MQEMSSCCSEVSIICMPHYSAMLLPGWASYSIHSVISTCACVQSEAALQLLRVVRGVKLTYTTVAQAVEIIAQWRKAQSAVIRTVYNQVREGRSDREILAGGCLHHCSLR